MDNIVAQSITLNNSSHIELPDWQEWLNSGVDPEIISLNVKSLTGNTPYEYLLYGDNIPRRNDGRIRDHVLRKFRHTEYGGWWCSGIDPLDHYKLMMWGCFKPKNPRRDWQKVHKHIKYEHPFRNETRVFCLQVPYRIWELISERYNTPITADDLDLGFWHWVFKNNLPITICEGAKKAGALLTIGEIAIGLPGVNGGYRTVKDEFGNLSHRRLIPDIQHFATSGRNFKICFDHDSKPETVQMVNAAINSFTRCLLKQGCSVSVVGLGWDYSEKAIDDLIMAHGVDVAREIIDSAASFEQWLVQGYSQLSYLPSVILNQRYLGNLDIPTGVKLIGLKSPKGTGKTETLSPIVADAIRNGQPVILLSHRVQLAQAICDRVGIPYVTEIRDSETGSLLGYGLCVDSLHPTSQARFNAEHWIDPLVIVDESEQVFWHLLSAATEVKTHRVEVIRQLSQLLKNALLPGEGKVILADADLSDLSFELVKGLAQMPQINPWIVVNHWKSTNWKVYHYNDTKRNGWLNALVNHIKDGGKPFICVDGQKTKSTWGTQVLERFLLKAVERYLKGKFPHLRILRIDSESIADPNHPAFGCVNVLNTVLLNYDVVLASPSVGTGVSIDIRGHFTSVWGCFSGVTPENSARQALARVREDVPRHIWVNRKGLGKIGNGAISLKSLLASEHKKFSYHIEQLVKAGMEIGDDIDTNRTALNIWGKFGCRINAGMVNYRQSVLDGLRSEGHTILDPNQDSDKSLVEELKAVKSELYLEECQAIANTDIIEMTPAQLEELDQQRSKTKTERYQVRKYKLHQRYGVTVTPALVAADDDGYYGQLRWHYLLTTGREFVELSDRSRSEQLIKDKSAWLPDYNRGQRGLPIRALELLGINQLIEPGKELRVTDELMIALEKNAKSVRWQMESVLSVKVTDKDTSITILKRILKKLGLELDRIGRDGSGERHYVYQVIGFEDGRQDIFKVWLDRDIQKLTKSENVSLEYKTSTSTSTFSKYIENEISDGQTDGQKTPANTPQTKPENTPQNCFVWDGQAWVGAAIKSAETLASGTFKALVTLWNGLDRYIWDKNHIHVC